MSTIYQQGVQLTIKKIANIHHSSKTKPFIQSILMPGVLCHHWYRVLDNFLPGRTLRTIVVKIAWDQVTLPDV